MARSSATSMCITPSLRLQVTRSHRGLLCGRQAFPLRGNKLNGPRRQGRVGLPRPAEARTARGHHRGLRGLTGRLRGRLQLQGLALGRPRRPRHLARRLREPGGVRPADADALHQRRARPRNQILQGESAGQRRDLSARRRRAVERAGVGPRDPGGRRRRGGRAADHRGPQELGQDEVRPGVRPV